MKISNNRVNKYRKYTYVMDSQGKKITLLTRNTIFKFAFIRAYVISHKDTHNYINEQLPLKLLRNAKINGFPK